MITIHKINDYIIKIILNSEDIKFKLINKYYHIITMSQNHKPFPSYPPITNPIYPSPIPNYASLYPYKSLNDKP